MLIILVSAVISVISADSIPDFPPSVAIYTHFCCHTINGGVTGICAFTGFFMPLLFPAQS